MPVSGMKKGESRMILVILVISLIVGIGAMILYNQDYNEAFLPIGVFGIFAAVASVITIVILGIEVKGLSVIDDRIAMYQEENSKIETQIAEVVKQYQEYETDIFADANPDSAIMLVSLYQELKSDSLVNSQIEVYVSNNQKIKELREEEIAGSVKRWWLYFGG